MGTILMLIFRFVLGWNAEGVSDYQIISLTASLDSIAIFLLIGLFKKRS